MLWSPVPVVSPAESDGFLAQSESYCCSWYCQVSILCFLLSLLFLIVTLCSLSEPPLFWQLLKGRSFRVFLLFFQLSQNQSKITQVAARAVVRIPTVTDRIPQMSTIIHCVGCANSGIDCVDQAVCVESRVFWFGFR